MITLESPMFFQKNQRFLSGFFIFCLAVSFISSGFAMEEDRPASHSSSSVRLVLPQPGESFDIINPCTDFGFKRAFSNSFILIDFLNHILNYQGDNQIAELSYLDKEFQSLDHLGRDFRVDIVCRTKNDRYFLIEMQNDYTEDYADKAHVEFARFLASIDAEKISDLPMGDRKRRKVGQTDVQAQEFWQKIEEVCVLVLSNKRFNPTVMKQRYTTEAVAEPDIINTYEMRHTAYPNRHLGTLDTKIVLVMLANFNKTADQLADDMDRWLYALKDERMASGKIKIEMFKQVPDIVKTASANEPLKQFYTELHTSNIGQDRLLVFQQRVEEDNARLDKMFTEGHEEGEKVGEKKAKRAAIQRMQNKQMKPDDICDILGISEQQLEEIMTEKDL